MERLLFLELAKDDQKLLQAALEVMSQAYAPYSQFRVGAAVRAKSGTTYLGTNLENASYGLTVCAEMAALSVANTAGDLATEAIAVVGGQMTAQGEPNIITPCGRCRQLLVEAGELAQEDVRVLAGNANLSQILVARISELLPYAFGITAF